MSKTKVAIALKGQPTTMITLDGSPSENHTRFKQTVEYGDSLRVTFRDEDDDIHVITLSEIQGISFVAEENVPQNGFDILSAFGS